jgi:hypothetical protein
VLDCVEDEDPTLVLMDDVKEDFVWEVEVARYRTKGKWGLLNLENSVNYGLANASSRRRKGKTGGV